MVNILKRIKHSLLDFNDFENVSVTQYQKKCQYRGIDLYDIYGTNRYKNDIAAYLVRNKLLPQQKATQRADEAAVMAVRDGVIVGLVTLYSGQYRQKDHLFFRTSISPDAQTYLLWQKAAEFTIETFHERSKQTNLLKQYAGFIIVLQNKKLDNHSVKKYLLRAGWSQEPKNSQNQSIWTHKFETHGINCI